MNAEQIQEARKLCDKATSIFPGNGEDDALRNLLIISTLLPAALDEIEHLQTWLKRIANYDPNNLDGEDAECMRIWAIRALVGEKVEKS